MYSCYVFTLLCIVAPLTVAQLCGYPRSASLPTGFMSVDAASLAPGSRDTLLVCMSGTRSAIGSLTVGDSDSITESMVLVNGSCTSIVATGPAEAYIYSQGVLSLWTGGAIVNIAGEWGLYGTPSPGTAFLFGGPNVFLTFDGVNAFVADAANSCIHKVTNRLMSLFAGMCGNAGSLDGTSGASSRFQKPSHIVYLSTTGSLYVFDAGPSKFKRISVVTGATSTLRDTATPPNEVLGGLSFLSISGSDTLLFSVPTERCSLLKFNHVDLTFSRFATSSSSCEGTVVGALQTSCCQFSVVSGQLSPIRWYSACTTPPPETLPPITPAPPVPKDDDRTTVYVVIVVVVIVAFIVVGVVVATVLASSKRMKESNKESGREMHRTTTGAGPRDFEEAHAIPIAEGGTDSIPQRPVLKLHPKSSKYGGEGTPLGRESPANGGGAGPDSPSGRPRRVRISDEATPIATPAATPSAADRPKSAFATGSSGPETPANGAGTAGKKGFLFPTIEESAESKELHDSRCEMVRKGEFEILQRVGKGTQAITFCCLLNDGSFLAMKELALSPDDDEDLVESLSNEVATASKWLHGNVIKYYGMERLDQDMKVRIFQEYAANGTLEVFVRNSEDVLPERIAKKYVRQIVAGMVFLHSQGVVHRDIKPSNILLTQDGICKLSDFSACTVVGTTTGKASQRANTMIGTPIYMAPEIILTATADEDDEEEQGYGKKADVWSLGITVLEMLNKGNPPWPEFPNQVAAFRHIALPDAVPIIPDRLTDQCKDFLTKCCQRDPSSRPRVKELMEHPWLGF